MISFAQTSTRHQKSQQQQLHQNQSNNQHHDYHQPDCPLELSNDYGFEYMAPSQLSASRLDSLTAFFDSLPLDSMQSDAWGGFTQYTPKLGRFTHQRESSLSSLGSNGPASPFTQQSANPHIAITESSGESLTDVHSHDTNTNQGGYYQLGKTMGSLSAYPHMDNAVTDMAYPVTISGPELNHKARVDRGLLPAPDFANPSTRSHPTSVASSVAGDSPATPTVGEADLVVDRRRQGCANVPKLGRTMTDVYGDELYNPNFAITSSSPQAHAPATCSPVNDMFKQRIHAANSQHLHSARHSPPTNPSGDISPFRAGSPLAPSSHNWNGVHGAVHFNSAQRMREHNKARQDVQFMQHPNTRGTETETPSTISPQDAMLEFNEQDDEANFPLFPQNTDTFGIDQMAGVVASNQPARANMSHEGDDGQFSYLQDQIQSGIQVPQQYPFIARPHIGDDAMMPRLSSTASSSGESSIITTATRGRPAMVGVEGGTYTCTYHGCSLRFETPSLLQKHKREGHRQINGMVGSRPLHDGVASTIMNSQAGPHRCDRINPSTGKSCNTVFSRPYDLTRHEDTIHNARKQKVHCNLCTEEKTFSRADALTRHYRVCHPDIELPGKHRRRGGD